MKVFDDLLLPVDKLRDRPPGALVVQNQQERKNKVIASLNEKTAKMGRSYLNEFLLDLLAPVSVHIQFISITVCSLTTPLACNTQEQHTFPQVSELLVEIAKCMHRCT